MQMNTQQIESTIQQSDRSESHPKLTAALTRDLLDGSVSPLDLCDYHDLTLNDLVAIINYDAFKYLKSSIEEINTARQSMLEFQARTTALSTLTELTRRPIESQQSAETTRKAATKLVQMINQCPNEHSNSVKNTNSPCLATQYPLKSSRLSNSALERESDMNKCVVSICVVAGLASVGHAAELYSQDFSTQSAGYSTSIAEFSDGTYDFFSQSTANSWHSSVVYNSADGAYFAGMDLDGEGAGLPIYLTTDTFNIAGATDLQFMIDLAEDQSTDGAEDWDLPDSVNFEYQVDGGSWMTIFTAINDGSTFNSAAFVDGVEITSTFETFGEALTGVTGTTMAIRITWDIDAGDEDLAIDNLKITGNTITVVPLPPAAFAGLGLLGCLAIKRRIRK